MGGYVNTYRLLEKESGQTIRLTVLTPESERGPSRLVVFSHGNGGAGALYRRLAEHLVRAGFVVALPDHPGNTRTDNRLAGTAANLEARPKHVKTVIDWAFGASPFAGTLKRDMAAILGHSLGGYTALAAAGDARVKALVLLAPATLWFQAPGSLDHVDVPILMFTAGQDEHTPAPHAEVVAVAGFAAAARAVAQRAAREHVLVRARRQRAEQETAHGDAPPLEFRGATCDLDAEETARCEDVVERERRGAHAW